MTTKKIWLPIKKKKYKNEIQLDIGNLRIFAKPSQEKMFRKILYDELQLGKCINEKLKKIK